MSYRPRTSSQPHDSRTRSSARDDDQSRAVRTGLIVEQPRRSGPKPKREEERDVQSRGATDSPRSGSDDFGNDWVDIDMPEKEGEPEEEAHTTSSLSEPLSPEDVSEKLKADLEVAKQQIQQKDDEISRLCKHCASSPVMTGEFHSAHSTPFTSLSAERDSPVGNEKGPKSMPTEVSDLQKKVTEKHKRIVELERRLDRAAEMNSEVERLTIELSKYDQGGKGSEVNPSKESSQGAAQEPTYIARLRQKVDELQPFQIKFEEAERRVKCFEKEYYEERRKHAELKIEMESLKSRIADVEDASGTTTSINDFTEPSKRECDDPSMESSHESKKGDKGKRKVDIRKTREMEKTQKKESEQIGKKKEWERMLKEKTHTFEMQLKVVEEKKKSDLQEKEKEIRALQVKVRELEKAAAALERIQQHSKAQSHQLMSLHDEVTARHSEKEDMISSMDNLQDYIGELEESRQMLAKERGQLKEQKQKLEGKLQVLKADMDQINQKMKRLETALQTSQDQCKSLKADMDQINQKMKRLETALQTSQDQCKSLKVENATLTAQIQKFGSLTGENSELHTQVSMLQEAIKKIERERDEVKSTLQATEAQVFIYKEDFETESADRERAHHQRTEEGERYKKEIERLHEELEHTKHQLQRHKGNPINVEDVHLQRQKELMSTMEQLKSAQEDIQAKTSQVKQYKKQHDQLTARVTALETDKQQLTEHFEQVRLELEKLKISSSKADLKAAKVAATKGLQEQLSKQTAEKDKIKEKSKKRKAKILELSSQYSDLKHEMERARKDLEKHSKAREKKKSTSRVSVSSPISDTEMSSQMEMDQLKQQCTDLQDQNDDLLVDVRTLRDVNQKLKGILQEESNGIDIGTSVDVPRQDGDATAVSPEDVSGSALSKMAKQKGSRNIQENSSRPRSQSTIEKSRTTADSGRLSGKKPFPQLSSTSRQPTQHHQRIQPLPPAVHQPHVSAAQPRGIGGAGKIDVQHPDRVNLSQAMTKESTSTSSQHRQPMPSAVPTPHARRSEGPDQANADYVNQSRVQAMLEEIKARKRQPSPESSHSAPVSADESLHLPPPFMTFPLDEQKGNSPEGASHPQNAGVPTTPDDVHGNIEGGYGRGQNVKSEHDFSSRGAPQQTAADIQGQSEQYYGGSGGYDGGAGGRGGGGYRAMGRGEEYGEVAQPKHQMASEGYGERAGAGGEQGRGGMSGVVGGRGGRSGGTAGGGGSGEYGGVGYSGEGRGEWRHSGGEYHEGGSGRIASQHKLPYERYSNSGPTSLPAQSSSLTPTFQRQQSLEGTQPARSDAISQQHTNVQEYGGAGGRGGGGYRAIGRGEEYGGVAQRKHQMAPEGYGERAGAGGEQGRGGMSGERQGGDATAVSPEDVSHSTLSKTMEMDQLKQQYTDLQDQLKDVDRLHREMNSLNSTIAAQGKEVERLQRENQRLQGDIETHRLTAMTYKEDFESERKDLHTIDSLAEKEAALQSGQKEIERLRSQCIQFDNQLRKMDADLAHRNQQVDQLSHKVADYNEAISKLRADLDSEVTRKTELESSLDRTTKEKNHWQQKSVQQDMVIQTTRQAVDQLHHEVNSLNSTITAQGKEVERLQRENQILQGDIETHRLTLESNELAKYNLVNVVSVKDDKTRGAGSYGSVRLVGVNGVPCIEKRLHEILLGKGRNEPVRPRDRDSLQMRFRNECILLSRINHPNIVQFVGVTYGPSPLDLTLIMEHVHMDLGKCLECYKDIPLPIKLSILLDVSYALLHLHSQHPAIIHRDLSAANVLVTPDMTAKVADLGMSRILDLESSVATAQKLTATPGALAYMAPETKRSNPRYGKELDIFSFGAVALFVANQEFPQVYEESTVEAVEKQEIQIEWRRTWLKKIGHRHCLYTLIIECLQDRPEKRPSTSDLMQRMRQLSLQYPRAFQDILQMHKEIENLQQCLSTANPSIEAERRTRSITEQIQHIRPIVDYSPDKPVYLNTDLPPTLPLDALPAQQRHLPHAAGYGPTTQPPQQAARYGPTTRSPQQAAGYGPVQQPPVPKPRRQGSQNTYY